MKTTPFERISSENRNIFKDMIVIVYWVELNLKLVNLMTANLRTLQRLAFLKVVSTTFLPVCFVCLKESTLEIRKNIFYFTLKGLFVLEKIRF